METIVANDIASEAVEAMKRNIAHNHLEEIVKTTQADAWSAYSYSLFKSSSYQKLKPGF